MTIFLAGASRGVGLEIAKVLAGQGHSVTALVRSTAPDELTALGVQTVQGDAMVPTQLEPLLAGASFSAVISTIGGMPTDGERPDYLANRNLMDAAVKAGISRFILVTSIGVGETFQAIPERAREALGPVLKEKEKAEQHLIQSGLVYTIVRPGGLKSEPATGTGLLTQDPRISGTIHRADVAQLVCRCLQSDRAHNQIFSAVDRTMLYGAPDFAECVL